jgi:hypothetical protein
LPGEVAAAGNVELLRWLVDSGCPYHTSDLCISAAKSGSIEVLAYLQQRGMLTDAEMMSFLLDVAAIYNNLAAAMWLKEQGADWPERVRNGPWGVEVLEWAIAEGFIAPTN